MAGRDAGDSPREREQERATPCILPSRRRFDGFAEHKGGARSPKGRSTRIQRQFGSDGMRSCLDIEACQGLCEIGRSSKAGGTTNFETRARGLVTRNANLRRK